MLSPDAAAVGVAQQHGTIDQGISGEATPRPRRSTRRHPGRERRQRRGAAAPGRTAHPTAWPAMPRPRPRRAGELGGAAGGAVHGAGDAVGDRRAQPAVRSAPSTARRCGGVVDAGGAVGERPSMAQAGRSAHAGFGGVGRAGGRRGTSAAPRGDVTGGVDSLLNGGSLLDANINITPTRTWPRRSTVPSRPTRTSPRRSTPPSARTSAPTGRRRGGGRPAGGRHVPAPGQRDSRRHGHPGRERHPAVAPAPRREPPHMSADRRTAGRHARAAARRARSRAPPASSCSAPVQGSGYREGAALVRRADGQMVQLGPLMYALLEAIDGRRGTAELADARSERLGRRLGDDAGRRRWREARRAGAAGRARSRTAPPRANPLLALRWKVLVTDPVVTRPAHGAVHACCSAPGVLCAGAGAASPSSAGSC